MTFVLTVGLDLARHLGPVVLRLPGDNVKIRLPELEWFERNTAILYPVLAVGVIVLLILGILSAFHSDELSGIVKVEYKREIINQLRRNPGGLSGDQLAKLIELKPLQAAKILEEMETDRMIASIVTSKGTKLFRLRGVGVEVQGGAH